jgi:hypothetical protein
MPLALIKRITLEAALGPMQSESNTTSVDAGRKLIQLAASNGVSIRDYLDLSIDVAGSDDKALAASGMSGYDAAKAFLNLPVKNDYKAGILLEAAGETFQSFPGVRALFPDVMDDIVQWGYRQDQFEQISALVANSRTISGTELTSTVIDDSEGDYDAMREISEGSRIPVYSIRAGEQAVKMFKHGMGYRTTYEFSRRARLDLITPYANRALRHAERTKVAHATALLINGDGTAAAADVVDQSALNAGATAGTLDRKALHAWLVNQAKAGTPIDTVVGNWDAYLQWLELFAMPVANAGATEKDLLARQGFVMGGVPILAGHVNFAISSTAPDGKLIGYSRADTLEELVEANSLISESEKAIQNQTITYVRTETTGYRLVFGDTRSILDYDA